MPDKFRPVESILSDSQLTTAGKFLLLLNQGQRPLGSQDIARVTTMKTAAERPMLGGFLGAIFAKLLDGVVSSYQAPISVPEGLGPWVDMAVWGGSFFLVSVLFTVVVLMILNRIRFLRVSWT